MFESWLRAPVVALIREALDAAGPHSARGPLLVMGDASLAQGLLRSGYDVHVAGVSQRAQKRFANVVDEMRLQAPPCQPLFANAVAVVAANASFAATLQQVLALTLPHGYTLLVTRGQRTQASGVVLGAGMLEIEQRQAGRVVVTSGTRGW